VDWIQLIKDVGFPVFVAVYLLVRFDGLLVALDKREAHEAELLQQVLEELRRFNESRGGQRAAQ